jgi:hypothetical protein
MSKKKSRSLDYQDEQGVWHIMCACGHTVSGSPRPGDKIIACPNCQLKLVVGITVVAKYPERIPEGLLRWKMAKATKKSKKGDR